MYKGIKLRGQKSLAKAVLLGLALSSVFAGAAFADGTHDLFINQRNVEHQADTTVMNKWDWTTDLDGYNQYAYTVGKFDYHLNKEVDVYDPNTKTVSYNNVTIVMKNNELEVKSGSATALIMEGFNVGDHNEYYHFAADGDVYVKNTVSDAPESTNAVYTYSAGDDKTDIDFSKAHSVVVISNGNVKDGSQALTAKNGGTIVVKTDKDTGYAKIIGDIDMCRITDNRAQNKITLDLNNSESYWYGFQKADKIDPDTGKPFYGNLELTISDGGEWIYTNGENTKKEENPKTYTTGRHVNGVITLKDGGIINLRNADVQAKFANVNNDKALKSGEEGYGDDIVMYDNGDHRYVSINNLQGEGGIFKLDLQYTGSDEAIYDAAAVTDKSDYIYVTEEGSGSQDVQFVAADAKLDDMTTDSKLYFANDKSGGVTFTSSTVDALSPKVSAANLYDYEYKVKSEETAEDGTDWYIGLDKGGENENKKIVDGVSKASFALATDMDRLNKRLGEARYLEGDDGIWVRYRHARTGWENSFKTSSNMLQLGYDKLKMDKDGKHYRGGALDYTDASTSLSGVSGHGDLDRYALSLYDTWIGDKGHYYDLVLRAGRVNSEFDALTRASETIKGKYHQFFVGISGEYGRKLASSNGWYVEPQAQLQIARVDSADYTTNYGVKVDQDAATSVIGRLGFRLGRDVSDTSNIYLKADWLHEFCGDQEYRLTAADGSTTGKFDGKDSWWDVGLGADFKMGDSSYLYCDFERTLGGNYDRTWQANVGVRFEF